MAEDSPMRAHIRDWFRPPRKHGEVIDGRTVSFLELFYDLVYVVLIAQIAHTLAGHITGDGFRDFIVVFILIWFAWLNGTLYHELHGGEDGRSRTYIFIQMALLALLSVYAAHAGDTPDDGRGFAVVYSILLAFLAWQWFDVRRQDEPERRPIATRYIAGLAVIIALAVISIFVDHDVRRTIWLITAALILFGGIVQVWTTPDWVEDSARVTESMAERFGLFTIIVLGEVVVGVVDGLGESERSTSHFITAFLALSIGFGFWWNYFDFIGRREPKRGTTFRMGWIGGHFIAAAGIAATGAGMVALIEHATDDRTPSAIAWLVGGGTAATTAAIALLAVTMPEHRGRRRVAPLLAVVSAIAVIVAAARPAPWLLALLLYGGLSVVWIDAFILHGREGERIAHT